MISIWYDTNNDNLAMAMIKKASDSVVAHYAKKFPGYMRQIVSSVPLGFQCGDRAERHWKYNTETKAIEEIIPSDAEKLADAKAVKIAEIKKAAGVYIEMLYPLQKQLNILRQNISADITDMSAYIDPARIASDAAETQVDSKTTVSEIEKFTFTL